MLIAAARGVHDHAFVQPGELWTAWNPVELVLLSAVGAAIFVAGGRSRSHRTSPRRRGCALLGIIVLAVAIASPLDALAGALASAHMVQHVLLILVAAPLLVVGAPMAPTLAAAPRQLRVAMARWLRRSLVRNMSVLVGLPLVAWLLHAAALWLWHSAVLYDAALRYPALHALEHMTFLATGLLFWNIVLAAQRRRRVSGPAAVLVVFTMGLQSVFLSALLTFAPTPWYRAYSVSAPAWGLDPLTDQQLAGLIMWIPAGLVYFGVAITIFAIWLARSDRELGAALAS